MTGNTEAIFVPEKAFLPLKTPLHRLNFIAAPFITILPSLYSSKNYAQIGLRAQMEQVSKLFDVLGALEFDVALHLKLHRRPVTVLSVTLSRIEDR